MRKHILADFQHVDHVDLHGDVRQNPRISGTTHNVFGITLGVGITLAIKKAGRKLRFRYFRVAEDLRKEDKLRFLEAGTIDWKTMTPDQDYTWIASEHADEYRSFTPIKEIFARGSLGLNTNRDGAVYDFDRGRLIHKVKRLIDNYNLQVDLHKRQKDAEYSHEIPWSSRLKESLARGQYASFSEEKVRNSVYRPFTKRWVFLDKILNQRTGIWTSISGAVIAVPGPGNRKPFGAMISDTVLPLDLAFEKIQCFPLSNVKDAALDQFQNRYADATITKEAIFNYIYALLHHPEYRERYAANLKRELPRIPFAPDFGAFAVAGRELARLHVEYESLTPWPLEEIENKDVPYTQRVTKMKLSPDKQSLWVNESLTLANMPPETFEYRLGSRSALEWIVDQYQVKGESDPNREDDPGYIIRLVGQVVRVSVETVAIVKSLPKFLP